MMVTDGSLTSRIRADFENIGRFRLIICKTAYVLKSSWTNTPGAASGGTWRSRCFYVGNVLNIDLCVFTMYWRKANAFVHDDHKSGFSKSHQLIRDASYQASGHNKKYGITGPILPMCLMGTMGSGPFAAGEGPQQKDVLKQYNVSHLVFQYVSFTFLREWQK